MAEQFCLIEKAILLAVNWEELVDCKWTKMPSSTLYHPNSDISHLQSASSSVNDDSSGGPVSSGTQPPQQGMYSRQKRMKQQEEKNTDGSQRGIEKVINRFNAVCQWVSSEIVQTRQMDDRVKLIEKFIRLAKVSDTLREIEKKHDTHTLLFKKKIRNAKTFVTLLH